MPLSRKRKKSTKKAAVKAKGKAVSYEKVLASVLEAPLREDKLKKLIARDPHRGAREKSRWMKKLRRGLARTWDPRDRRDA
jgi:hypothetical protein